MTDNQQRVAPKPSIPTRLYAQLPGARGLLYGAVGAGFVSGALFAIQAVLLSYVVDGVFLQSQTLAAVLPLLGLMVALLLVRVAVIWAADILAQRSAGRVKTSLRQQLLDRLVVLGPARLRADGERSGELVGTVAQGVEALDDYITQFLPARYLAGLVPAFVFLLVLILDPLTTLVLLFAGPMLILMLAYIGGRAKAITERRFLELSWMSAFFLDVLQGIATLKMFGRSREQADNIEEISQHYGKTTMEVLATAFQTSLVMEWAATAATALVALEVSYRLMAGSLPFSQALAVLLLTPEFFMPLRQMALRYHAGTAGKAAAERVFEILDSDPGQSDGKGQIQPATPAPVAVPVLPARYDIHFDRVSYTYPSTEEEKRRPALRDFSLTLPAGQTVALVGPSGAGKTTVSSLLLRFIDTQEGAITAGGVSLGSIDRAVWRRQVAWVPQMPHLFYGSVLDNIRLAQPGASMAEIITAAEAAHAHEFISALPQGYDTPLGERGERLSGGQAQRIAIARAFLKDAPVLLLDEATAHLDARSEALVQESLAQLMRGRTVLIIAHRLKLVYAADQIVVMDAGRAVEEGDHQTLLRRGGLYGQLVTSYQG
ncbi:MAG: thiol reductant ABC exporter subunit CydD [Anaerolineae bacterium]|nr:thiol reductant ABC exporter subunit CydD [Anaerolineae bacterium]